MLHHSSSLLRLLIKMQHQRGVLWLLGLLILVVLSLLVVAGALDSPYKDTDGDGIPDHGIVYFYN